MKRLAIVAALALAACTSIQPVPISSTAALGETAGVDGLLIRPLKVLEDSRCPINARCVWAGRIIVRTDIQGGNWRQTRDLELGKPQPIADGRLTLVAAEPGKLAGAETDPRAYRFTFAFEGGL